MGLRGAGTWNENVQGHESNGNDEAQVTLSKVCSKKITTLDSLMRRQHFQKMFQSRNLVLPLSQLLTIPAVWTLKKGEGRQIVQGWKGHRGIDQNSTPDTSDYLRILKTFRYTVERSGTLMCFKHALHLPKNYFQWLCIWGVNQFLLETDQLMWKNIAR